MIDLIKEIIAKFGPRPAGSKAEADAQEFIAGKCRAYTDAVAVIPFDDHLDARFGKLRYYVLVYLIALALFWLQPLPGLILSLINAVVLITDLMMYRDVLTRFPGKQQRSYNVQAVLEPKGEVKSTLIFSGHMDSTREFRWWYKLGELGVKLTVIAGVIIVLQPLFYLWHVLSPSSLHTYIWGFFLLLSPVLMVYWTMYADNAVDGAQDNLSGIAIAFEVFRQLADPEQKGKNKLQHTRIKFLSFGSEEKGLIGSRAFVKQYREILKTENAFLINIDGVRLADEIAIVEREMMTFTTHDAALVRDLNHAFAAENIPVKKVMIPIGGSDAVSFGRAGLPATTIIGIKANEYDFTYHTRHDIADNVDPKGLLFVKNALITFARNWDGANAVGS